MTHAALSHLYQEELYQVPEKILVVLAKPWPDHTEDETALLAKILGSVGLNLAAVTIIVQNPLSLDTLPNVNAPKILVFGSAANDIDAYQVVKAQGFTVILADDLKDLDDQKKKSLWMALKTMFGR